MVFGKEDRQQYSTEFLLETYTLMLTAKHFLQKFPTEYRSLSGLERISKFPRFSVKISKHCHRPVILGFTLMQILHSKGSHDQNMRMTTVGST